MEINMVLLLKMLVMKVLNRNRNTPLELLQGYKLIEMNGWKLKKKQVEGRGIEIGGYSQNHGYSMNDLLMFLYAPTTSIFYSLSLDSN